VARHRDDSEMSRFDRDGVRHFTARQSMLAVGLVALILLVLSGGSVLSAAEEEKPGTTRTILKAVGEPAAKMADNPLASLTNEVTAKLSPDEELDPNASFAAAGGAAGEAGGAVSPVTPDYFDATELGEEVEPGLPLETLLVTGDSLSQPLDVELARRLSGQGIKVVRDPHIGTGISNESLVDWGQVSASQVKKHSPQAVVMFLGANEGYPMTDAGGATVDCCSPEWAALYANRARQVIANFRQEGAAKVYWLTVPMPRDPERQRVARVVNEAIAVAAQPWRSDVRVLDTDEVFAPEGTYSDTIEIDGKSEIVRESDGIHLNPVGSDEAADVLLERLGLDFQLK
jgi:lysophospholipase L1-like esterase